MSKMKEHLAGLDYYDGFHEGIREVVEWVKKNGTPLQIKTIWDSNGSHSESKPSNLNHADVVSLSASEWQAKLKEWEIDDE